VEIKIGDKYKITSDTFNVIVNQRFNKKVQEGADPEFDYKPVSFHPTLEKACISLLNKEIREIDTKSIDELIQVIKIVTNEICHAVAQPKNVCVVTGEASDANIELFDGQVIVSQKGAKLLVDSILREGEKRGWLD